MEYIRAIFGWIIMILAGLLAADVAITVLYSYQVVDFLLVQDGLTQMMLIADDGLQIGWAVGFYLAADLIAFIASKIAGGDFRFPRYANPIVTILMGVVMLLIFPIYGAIKSVFSLIHVLFMFLWWLLTKKKGDKLNWGSGSGKKGSGGSGEGHKILKKKVKEICTRYERAYDKTVGAGTRIYATVRGEVVINSINVNVKLRFSIRTDVVNTDYDMQKERNMIRDIVQRFPSESMKNEILSVAASLAASYPDVHGSFGVKVLVDHDIQTV